MAKRLVERGGRTLSVRPAVAEALEVEGAIRSAAAARELGLVVTFPRRGTTDTAHFQFNSWETGRRVLDWWPGSGTWRRQGGGSGIESDWRAVVKLAADL